MAVIFKDLHTESGLKSLDDHLAGKSYISGDVISKDDIKVYGAVLEKPNNSYSSASKCFPGQAVGVRFSDQAAPAESAPAQEKIAHSFGVQMEDEIEGKKKTLIYPSQNALQDWSLWQLLDSILPTGGFAHSFGLESSVQTFVVNSPEDLHNFVINLLENTGSLLLPFVHAATISHDIKTWHKLDKVLDAILTNEVSRKASMAQGSALLRVAASMFTELPCLKAMRDESLGNSISFHHAPIFGLVCGLLGLSLDISQRAYLFVTLRDVISATTRLNLIGPQGAAILQHKVASIAEEILKKWKDRNVEDACQIAPMIDVVQGCHSYLFSRMFCS